MLPLSTSIYFPNSRENLDINHSAKKFEEENQEHWLHRGREKGDLRKSQAEAEVEQRKKKSNPKNRKNQKRATKKAMVKKKTKRMIYF